MIDEKKINKAMSSYATETFNHIEERFAAMCGFKEGAQWAQKELIKSLWHDASEKPKQHKMIVAITGGTDSLTNFDAEVYNFPFKMSKGDWVDLVDQDGIVRWCYLSDLLPKEGGVG